MNSKTQGAAFGTLMLVATLAFGSIAEGQRPSVPRAKSAPRRVVPNERSKGIMLGVHTIAAPGISIPSEVYTPGYGTNFGLGAGVMLGYDFNRRFSSFVSLDVAKQGASNAVEGTWGLGHLEIGARAYFPEVSLGWPRTVPYLIGSVGRRALAAHVYDEAEDESSDVAFHGVMLGLGAGIEHYFGRNMSFDAGLHLGFGTFDHFSVDGETDDYRASSTTSVRLRLGVTWRP